MFILLAIKVSDSTENIVLNVGEILYIDSAVKNIKELRAVKQQSGQDVTLKHFDIELKNVGFAYKDGQKIIDGVSFVAKQNEITALVGPSGCGKTTLLGLLSRLLAYMTIKKVKSLLTARTSKTLAPIVYLTASQLSFKTLRCLIIRFWKIFAVVQDVNYQLFTESVWSEISLVSDDDVVKKDALTQFGLIDKIE